MTQRRMTSAEYLAEVAAEAEPRRSKYGARASYRCKSCDAPMTKDQAKCRCCGGEDKRFFASRGEARRYDVLRAEEKRGAITDLECQPSFELTVNGVRVGVYKADYRYRRGGVPVVEDFKSEATMTEAAKLRMRLAEAIYGIKIRMIYKPGSSS